MPFLLSLLFSYELVSPGMPSQIALFMDGGQQGSSNGVQDPGHMSYSERQLSRAKTGFRQVLQEDLSGSNSCSTLRSLFNTYPHCFRATELGIIRSYFNNHPLRDSIPGGFDCNLKCTETNGDTTRHIKSWEAHFLLD